jgi:hypothetical protein
MKKKAKVVTAGFLVTTLIAFVLFVNTAFKNVGKIDKVEED